MVSCYRCSLHPAGEGGLCKECRASGVGGPRYGNEPIPGFREYQSLHLAAHPAMTQVVVLDGDLAIFSYDSFIGRFTRLDEEEARSYLGALVGDVIRGRFRAEAHDPEEILSFRDFVRGLAYRTETNAVVREVEAATDPSTLATLRKGLALHGHFFDPADLGHLQERTIAYILELYLLVVANREGATAAVDTLRGTPDEWSSLGRRPVLLVPLRDYQQDFLDRWTRGPRAGILEMATATGKTVVGLAAIERAARERGPGFKALVATNSHAILQQWRREIGAKLGVGTEGVNTGRGAVELWTVQTLAGRTISTEYDIAVFDEVHHLAAPEWKKALAVPSRRKLGLSATVTGEHRVHILREELGPVVATLSVGEAKRRGILPEFRWIVHPVELSPVEAAEFEEQSRRIRSSFLAVSASGGTSQVLKKLAQTSKGRFAMAALSDIADFVRAYNWASYTRVLLPQEWHDLFGRIQARQWISHRSLPKLETALHLLAPVVAEKKCMVTTMDIETAEKVAAALGGPNTFVVHSKLGHAEVERRLEAFRRARHGALVAPKLLDEGIDVPDASVGFNIAGSKSRIQLVQRLGRILRPAPGKEPEFHHFVTLPPQRDYLAGIDDQAYVDDLLWIHELARAIDVKPEFAGSDVDAQYLRSAHRSGKEGLARALRGEPDREVALPSGSVRFAQIIEGIPREAAQVLARHLKGAVAPLEEGVWAEALADVRRQDLPVPQGVWWLFVAFAERPDELVRLLSSRRGPGDAGSDDRASPPGPPSIGSVARHARRASGRELPPLTKGVPDWVRRMGKK